MVKLGSYKVWSLLADRDETKVDSIEDSNEFSCSKSAAVFDFADD